ncbi:hypothetical protein [Alicyclobacillus ferrooxydans]|uniref:Uncharacterized protein n=1 Tax=Alicyclobacillus ferrooxydans TaxID=471514 RepID=A0A0P9CEF6_9BACL|nr:hypothetical protein [Alicyclobacillus ferrooxydans]KPV41280.1 hypothetical protein AN477_20695 [Alicyclobacillus ferrooxydans]
MKWAKRRGPARSIGAVEELSSAIGSTSGVQWGGRGTEFRYRIDRRGPARPAGAVEELSSAIGSPGGVQWGGRGTEFRNRNARRGPVGRQRN